MVLLAAGWFLGLCVPTGAAGEGRPLVPHIEEGDVNLWMRYYEAQRGWKPRVEELPRENAPQETREPDDSRAHDDQPESREAAQPQGGD